MPLTIGSEVEMSLVMAATASDGVVIIADTQETRRNAMSGDTREEHHVKVACLADDVIIGFAGAGQWAYDLVLRIKQELPPTIAAEEAAALVRDRIAQTDGFPEVAVMIAGTRPQPRLMYFNKRGSPLEWTSVLHPPPPYNRFVSCGADFLAKWLFRVFHDALLTVDEVAALGVACVLETSEISPTVSRDLMIVSLRVDGTWSGRNTEEAKDSGGRFVEELRRLRPSLKTTTTGSACLR
jgi:20S proteasome alpha/beta subunit